MTASSSPESPPSGNILLYTAEDGTARIEVRMEGETVWLTQKGMAELFQTTPQNITQHIAALYKEGELVEAATCKDFLQVQPEGSRVIRRMLRNGTGTGTFSHAVHGFSAGFSRDLSPFRRRRCIAIAVL